jgi:D-alanyl-D-alanine carboxypeptidase
MARTKLRAAAGVAMAAVVLVQLAPLASASQHPIQPELDTLTSAERIPGALAQVRDRYGRTTTLTSGTAELNTGRPMVGPRADFRIASVTKPFVAITVLQLVAEGKVRLDEPIETYLPGVVRGTGEGAGIHGRDFTVRQLLQHTSGIPNYTKYLDRSDMTKQATPQQLLDLAFAHKVDFPPGQSWSYSNTGYILAGLLVERVTGKDVATSVTERVIRRAGLHDTYWPSTGDRTIRGQHAHNYVVNPADPQGPLVDVTEFEPSLAGSAGSMISTPSDLNRFWEKLFDGKLLPARELREMMTTVPTPELGEGFGYGLGLVRAAKSCGGFGWGHGGDLIGVTNMSFHNDKGGEATVYLTAQTGSPQISKQMQNIVDMAFCRR